MGCCNCTSKTCLIFISFVFWAFAAGLIFIGSLVFTTYNHVEQIASATYTLIPAVIIIGVGVVMFLIGLIGCVGGCKENKCILATFFTLLLIILTAMVVAGVLAYIYRNKVSSGVEKGMNDVFKRYGNDSTATSEVDYLQKNFECCGIHNFTDWMSEPWHDSHKDTPYPNSCCKSNACNYTIPVGNNTLLYKHGCFEKLRDDFMSNLAIIAGTATGFAVIQIMGMIASCVLFCRSREDPPYIGLDNSGMRV